MFNWFKSIAIYYYLHSNQNIYFERKPLSTCLFSQVVWNGATRCHRRAVVSLLRPLKINCAFWVTLLVPLALSGRKTCTLYFMFTLGQQIFMCRKFSRTSAKYLRKLCVFFHCARFFVSLARSVARSSLLTQNTQFILRGLIAFCHLTRCQRSFIGLEFLYTLMNILTLGHIALTLSFYFF